MPRYVKQRDEYSCAPIALLNLCKCAGVRCTYNGELYRWIKKRCGCKPGQGSPGPAIYATLLALARDYDFAVRPRLNPSVKEIREELKRGNAVLLCGQYDDEDEHIALLIGHSRKRGFHAINWFFGRRVDAPMSEAYMRKVAKRHPFCCWFVRDRLHLARKPLCCKTSRLGGATPPFFFSKGVFLWVDQVDESFHRRR